MDTLHAEVAPRCQKARGLGLGVLAILITVGTAQPAAAEGWRWFENSTKVVAYKQEAGTIKMFGFRKNSDGNTVWCFVGTGWHDDYYSIHGTMWNYTYPYPVKKQRYKEFRVVRTGGWRRILVSSPTWPKNVRAVRTFKGGSWPTFASWCRK